MTAIDEAHRSQARPHPVPWGGADSQEPQRQGLEAVRETRKLGLGLSHQMPGGLGTSEPPGEHV